MGIYQNIEKLNGKPVIELEDALAQGDLKSVAVLLRCEYGEPETLSEKLLSLLSHADIASLDALVFGMWMEDDEAVDVSPDPVVELLVTNKDKLPNLTHIFFGDITAEENEISWITQGDMSAIWGAFPKLTYFTARGGNGLQLGKINHPKLTYLAVETGGMPAPLAREALNANAPLEHFELWLGSDEYGDTTSVSDFTDLIQGKLFPNLKVLALRNCEYTDDLVEALATSPILGRVEKLDLSLGTLTDRGARALIAGGQLSNIDLDISHHYVTKEVEEELRAAAKSLKADDREVPDTWDGEDHYYVAVSE